METTILTSPPTARVRISHKYVNKQWQHETTVELTFDCEGSREHYASLAEWLTDADGLGRAEAERRTALDAHALAEQEAK